MFPVTHIAGETVIQQGNPSSLFHPCVFAKTVECTSHHLRVHPVCLMGRMTTFHKFVGVLAM